MNTEEYIQGMRDARKGIPHQPGKGKDYDDGYSLQMESEACLTEMGLMQDRNMGIFQ